MFDSNSAHRAKPVGVIGLGLMGAAICDRLLDDGYDIVVYNRSRAKAEPFIARGARWSANPFVDCDRVIVSLYDTEVVEHVLAQMERSFRPGQFLIDTTTGDPQRMHDLGVWFAERGVEFLEAPISGSSDQTRRHLSTAVVAGSEEALAACRDLLDCMAVRTFYVGRWGNAVRMKLVTNLVLGLNRAVLAEGLVFAKAAGLSADAALEVLMNSPAYSRTMDGKGPKMVAGEFAPQAKLSQHIKDVHMMLDEAARAGQGLPLSRTHLDLLEQAVANGLGELDNSVIIRVLEEAAPVGQPPMRAVDGPTAHRSAANGAASTQIAGKK